MALILSEPNELEVGDGFPHDFIKTQVFYLGYGRNAWYSTWTNRYYSHSVSFSEDELKHTAEKRRVQGSVFNIQSMMMFVCSINAGRSESVKSTVVANMNMASC
jgi:hypothetical protein